MTDLRLQTMIASLSDEGKKAEAAQTERFRVDGADSGRDADRPSITRGARSLPRRARLRLRARDDRLDTPSRPHPLVVDQKGQKAHGERKAPQLGELRLLEESVDETPDHGHDER